MNWHYLDSQQRQIGPISDLEIQSLVSAGTLNTTSLVWNETLSEWVSVGQTPLATFCTTATPPIVTSAKPTNTAESATLSEQVGLLKKSFILIKSLWGKTTAAAQLSKKQALQQKLRMVDLKQADYKIGCKAFKCKIAYNNYESLYTEIEEVKSQIVKLKTKTSEPNDTLTRKAKAAVISAAKAAEIGTQTINEKKALIKLGRKLRANPCTHPSLTEEIGVANSLIEKASILDNEILTISTKTFFLAKYSWLILPIVIIVSVCVVSYVSKVAHESAEKEARFRAYISEQVAPGITDSEDTQRGLNMIRAAGIAKGGEFAQTYGRSPTTLEFDAILSNAGITPEAINQGTPETVKLNKRIEYEFRRGFEEGCTEVAKAIHNGNQPAF